ncbi:hypothetical protein V1514DRAFT_332402 [Lipomyces japonicus]|uniref:uncharacterized protein n=1 Tax=Lipomyces japonicus TaxID=56871 RepID=UPI0034CF5B40
MVYMDINLETKHDLTLLLFSRLLRFLPPFFQLYGGLNFYIILRCNFTQSLYQIIMKIITFLLLHIIFGNS